MRKKLFLSLSLSAMFGLALFVVPNFNTTDARDWNKNSKLNRDTWTCECKSGTCVNCECPDYGSMPGEHD